MKKFGKKIGILLAGVLCAGTATAGLAACKSEDTYTLQSGASTTLVTTKSPEELSPENVAYAFLQKQSELQSYTIVTEGKAVADLAGYEQEIHNTSYKNGEDFLNQASSDSILVKMKHQAFSKGGKVVYRDSFDGDLKVATKEEYKKVYGFTADDVTLGGYIINAKTLRYAALEKTEGETLTYYFRLAGDLSKENGSATESATTGVRLQAKAYGSLDDLPSFSDVDLRLTIKKDWTPVGYSSECSYDCKKIFNMSIKQTLTCTYANVNSEVKVPSVEEFNAKLGTMPSEVKPSHGEENALMQLTSAIGAAFDRNEKLSIPLSLGINLFGAPITLGGNFTLQLKREALSRGDVLNAFVLRYDLDISPIPLLSQVANTVTLRYMGEGVLFVILNNRTESGDHYLFTYTADIGTALPLLEGISIEQLQNLMSELFDLEKTENGFRVALKAPYVEIINESYAEIIAQAAAMLGDTHGYVNSLLGSTFTALYADVQGVEKVTGVSLAVEGTPAENTTMGEKIDVSIDTKLMGGAFAKPFTGELAIRLEPSAVWKGDFLGAFKASLRLDLSPAQPILKQFATLGGMIPDMPSWLSADLNSLDVYYMGDGVMTLVLNNKVGDPIFVTDVDLTQMIPAAATLDGEADGTQGVQGLKLPQIIFEIKENGFEISLGETLVQALDAAYQALVQAAIDYVTEAAGEVLGDFAPIVGTMINGWFGANITGAGIFVGRDNDGKATFCLTITGCPTSGPYKDHSVALLSLTFTHQGELSADEKKTLLANGETIEKLEAANDKAAEYDAQLQKFIDEMDVSESGYDKYVKDVTALQEKIASEKDGVKSLMATGSYLAETTYGDNKYTVLLLTAELYHERAEQFKEKLAKIDVSSDEAEWDELNALYDKNTTVQGIAVPAIGENEILKAAVGEETIASYLAKRNAHEDAIVQTLISQIATSKATYQNAADRSQLTAALTEIVTKFKPVYDKLPADKQANVSGYSEYVKDIYIKNIDGVTKEYQAVKAALDALSAQGDAVTIEKILDVMKQLSEAYAWGYGYDYWETNTIEKVQTWGTTWITSLKPVDLSEEAQTKVSDLNTLNRSLMKGTTATEVLGKYTELIIKEVRDLYEKIGKCRTVGDDGKDTWDFGTLENKEAVLERIHGLRFLICKVLPTSINDEIGKDPELNQFARIDLTKYEKALAEHLQSTSDD